MQYRQLRYYVKIVEAGSFSRAAALIHVAQPALSLQISELEDYLGVSLLQRSARGVRPTPAGDLLYREAVTVLKHLEQIPGAVRSSRGVAQGVVSVGLASILGPALVGRFVETCHAALGKVSLKLTVSDSAALMEKLAAQSLDLALVFEDDLSAACTREPLYQQRLYVFHPRTLALGSSVSLEELVQHPLVLPGHPNLVRSTVDRACAAAGLTPNLVAEVDDYTSLLSTVGTGMGATILPRGDRPQHGDDIAGPALIEPPLYMTVSLVSSQETPLSYAADEVRKVLRGYIERHVRETQPPGAAWVDRDSSS
jgi:LysR family transcriptional regulator, nitrogen assimilation regulatory protein